MGSLRCINVEPHLVGVLLAPATRADGGCFIVKVQSDEIFIARRGYVKPLTSAECVGPKGYASLRFDGGYSIVEVTYVNARP